MRLGVLADTHGVLDPRALPILAGVDRILHAGDIGDQAVLTTLAAIAPVTAVQGNIDQGKPLGRLYPAVQRLHIDGVRIYLTHVGGKPHQLMAALPDPRPDLYIFGHSHTALLATIDGVTFLNPGAAGRPRFGGGLSVALIELNARQVSAQIIPLE